MLSNSGLSKKKKRREKHTLELNSTSSAKLKKIEEEERSLRIEVNLFLIVSIEYTNIDSELIRQALELEAQQKEEYKMQLMNQINNKNQTLAELRSNALLEENRISQLAQQKAMLAAKQALLLSNEKRKELSQNLSYSKQAALAKKRSEEIERERDIREMHELEEKLKANQLEALKLQRVSIYLLTTSSKLTRSKPVCRIRSKRMRNDDR